MQSSPSEIIRQLTETTSTDFNRQQSLAHSFAREFGWRPSDYFPAYPNDIANSHLLVEHGLKNTAVLTFLNSPNNFANIGIYKIKKILSLSYNNLIDWHLIISREGAVTLYNRVKESWTRVVHTVNFQQGEKSYDELRSEKFEQLVGRRPNPNLPPLDDALIKNISYWKRTLSLEISDVTTEQLSSLFNAIIFARAVEDSSRNAKLRTDSGNQIPEKYLLEKWNKESNPKIGEFLYKSITSLVDEQLIPTYLIEKEQLTKFDSLDANTIRILLTSFYYQDSIPYEYDFSIMSKHALSRIYEHYVSILKTIPTQESTQGTFWEMSLPKEEKNKAYGSIYTPQFIARFFARYFRKTVSPKKFLTAKIADPACGSGIFLRTFLEQRFEQTVDNLEQNITPEIVRESFKDIFGMDIDPNATHATRLSLALLHLALKDSFPNQLNELENFPESINIVDTEAIEYLQKNHELLENSQDVVVANPPFVRIEDQPEVLKERLINYMHNYADGRIGSELAFIRIAIEILRPNGIGFFVLPHNFMLSESALKMRQELSEKTWILCLADLSEIEVFKGVNVYTVLLVFQKKAENSDPPKATIVKCRDFVEKALQNVLDGNEVEKTAYSIYETKQDVFKSKHWMVVPKSELNIETKFRNLPKISDFLEIRQGFVSGADPIFIRFSNEVPKKERQIYTAYLPDREMLAYNTPVSTDKVVFYPFIKSKQLTEDDVRKDFPETWQYLEANKEKLMRRSGRNEFNWWKPTSPRQPERLIIPKIITPNLTISPRFSIDTNGKYAISRSPLFYPKGIVGNEQEILRYFLAVLNSSVCYWYISNHSHKLGKGYAKLEPKTLKDTPVPSPEENPLLVKQIVELVDKRLASEGKEAIEIERELDNLVSKLYGLSEEEKSILRMEK